MPTHKNEIFETNMDHSDSDSDPESDFDQMSDSDNYSSEEEEEEIQTVKQEPKILSEYYKKLLKKKISIK